MDLNPINYYNPIFAPLTKILHPPMNELVQSNSISNLIDVILVLYDYAAQHFIFTTKYRSNFRNCMKIANETLLVQHLTVYTIYIYLSSTLPYIQFNKKTATAKRITDYQNGLDK
jgi:hypothetical protein